MRIDVCCDPEDIARAIDCFPANYHDDFARVRTVARQYLVGEPGGPLAEELAAELRTVLSNWGAGKRAAPSPRSSDSIAETLSDARLHADLRGLASLGLGGFALEAGRGSVHGNGDRALVLGFGGCLHRVLLTLADGVLCGNTAMTCPTKALTLLTGLSPALDRNVRSGLTDAGVTSFGGTWYPLPREPASSEFLSFYALLFVLGDCWHRHEAVLSAGVEMSRERRILDDFQAVGRLFDVLLFQGAQSGSCLRATGCDRGWYNRLL